ncbi:hypothetical protein KW786_00970 [Candidatus Parcubacteria bacterium]|nr:hypothetical protein [Candidatus Parcubacteria bacterium]
MTKVYLYSIISISRPNQQRRIVMPRLDLEVSLPLDQRLGALAKKKGIDKVALIRRALAVYEALDEAVDGGAKICTVEVSTGKVLQDVVMDPQ